MAAVGVQMRIVVGAVAGDRAGGGDRVVVVLVRVRVRVHQAADAEVDFLCGTFAIGYRLLIAAIGII